MRPVAVVSTFRQYANNGRYIRMATRVTFNDGYVVNFMEKLPKRLALTQADMQRAKESRA